MPEYRAPRGEMKKLANGIYAYLQPFVFYSSNAGLVAGEKEALVVDSLTNRYMIENFIGKIKEVTDKPARFLVNTHPHGDHTYTNHFFTEATVICSAKCREVTLQMPQNCIEKARQEVPDMSFDGAKDTPQDLVFEKSLTLYQDGREIRVVCLGPGHSPSDTYVFLPEEQIVFCGDILFSGTPPLSLAGSVLGHLKQLEILAGLEAKIYVAGHGPVVGIEKVYDARDYLQTLLAEARKCFDQGLSFQEAARTIDLGKKEWKSAPAFFIFAQCARAYSEFRGEEPGSPLNINLAELVPARRGE